MLLDKGIVGVELVGLENGASPDLWVCLKNVQMDPEVRIVGRLNNRISNKFHLQLLKL